MKHRVAAIQMTSGDDVEKNLAQAEKLIKEAAAQQAELIVLPEMFPVMGKAENDKLKAQEKLGAGLIQNFLAKQAVDHKVCIVGGTIPIATDNPHKVSAACLVYDANGKLVARYDKIHLFDVLVGVQNYRESATIEAGKQAVVVDTPLGKLGLAVCYDIRFPELFQTLVTQGATIIAIPTAFTATTGAAHWHILIRALAIQTQCYVIASCQEGTHPNGRQTHGESMIIDPWGTVLAQLPKGVGVITAEIDQNYLQQIRAKMPLQQHRR